MSFVKTGFLSKCQYFFLNYEQNLKRIENGFLMCRNLYNFWFKNEVFNFEFFYQLTLNNQAIYFSNKKYSTVKP